MMSRSAGACPSTLSLTTMRSASLCVAHDGETLVSMAQDLYNPCMADKDTSDFNDLTPDTVLDLVEDTLGVRCTNICRPLNSYINRVYEVPLEEGDAAIIKVYRPGRWSLDALQDEHDFMLDLRDAEIPVVYPLESENGETLHRHEHLHYAIYPKKGGRICDEPTQEEWELLGRLLARVHVVGGAYDTHDRISLTPDHIREQAETILDSGLVTVGEASRYEDTVFRILDLIEPMFDERDMIRIHGDCHHQNIIYRPDDSFYIIDFDDMALGLPVQDVWMLLPGRVADSQRELQAFLKGYNLFRPFDEQSLHLVEALRAMRYIHFTAWCARQVEDGGFTRLSPDWGSESYWGLQIQELKIQEAEILDSPSPFIA